MEVLSHDTLRLHPNVAASVDALLAGRQPVTQLRKHKNGKYIVRFETPEPDVKRNVGRCAVGPSWLKSLAELEQ